MKKYGLNVYGKIRVFSKTKEIKGANKKTFEVTDHWFNVSEKEESGWVNSSMNMFFPKGSKKPEHNTIIDIIDSNFLLSGVGKYRRIALFVREWVPSSYTKEDKKD